MSHFTSDSAQVERVKDAAKRVSGLYSLLDPMRHTYTSFYPRWYVLPQSGVTQLQAPDDRVDKPFSLYVHIPFCRVRCPDCLYCRVEDKKADRNAYLQYLRSQLTLYGKAVPSREQLKAIYIGGGTPSELAPDQITALLQILGDWAVGKDRSLWQHDRLTEVSFECHPESIAANSNGEAKLRALLDACGKKLRLSIGVQSLQPALLRGIRLGRGDEIHGQVGYDECKVKQLLQMISRVSREHAINSVPRVNLDFMFGFKPVAGQTLESELDLVEDLLDDAAETVSALTFYQLWHGTDRVPVLGDRSSLPLSARIRGLEHLIGPIVESRQRIAHRLEQRHFRPEVASIWRSCKLKDAHCSYHTDFLYGNGNVLPLGVSSYGYWNGYAFMAPVNLRDYTSAINRREVPIDLGATLPANEQEFRAAVLSLKRHGESVDISALGAFLGDRDAEKAVELLTEAKLAKGKPNTCFALTDDGFLLVEEIISWFLTMPPLRQPVLEGKARTVDRLSRHAVREANRFADSSSDKYQGILAKWLTIANEHLDECFRHCWPLFPDGDERYLCCLCAVQSRHTERPLFPNEVWCTADDRESFSGDSEKAILSLDKLQRYAAAREFFDLALSVDSTVSVFRMFFMPPFREKSPDFTKDEGGDERFAYLHAPPALICHTQADTQFGRASRGRADANSRCVGDAVDITNLLSLIDRAVCERGAEPLNGPDWQHTLADLGPDLSEPMREELQIVLRAIRDARRGLWPVAPTRGEETSLREQIDRLIDKLGNGLEPNALATFCLYWALLRERPSQSRTSTREEDRGKMILHMPYLSYHDKSQGGAIVFLDGTRPPTYDQISFLKSAVGGILTRFGTQEFTGRERRLRRSFQDLSKRAAAAAILARNMSHHIGSHVTPRTKQEDLRARVEELLMPVFRGKETSRPALRLLASRWVWGGMRSGKPPLDSPELLNRLERQSPPTRWKMHDWEKRAFPVIQELHNTLDDYVQRKAEFIAEFSTDPLISTRAAWFYREVILPFVCNTALIDTLAANEGFRYLSDSQPGIVVRCFVRNGGSDAPDELRVSFHPEGSTRASYRGENDSPPYGMRYADDCDREVVPDILVNEGDSRVALPGPVGEMAIYSILENIIRNAAKHGSRVRGVGESEDCEHLPVTKKLLEVHVVLNAPESQDYYDVAVYDNLSSIADDEQLARINKHITDDIVEPTGEPRKGAWGTAEMKLCAALLEGIKPTRATEAALYAHRGDCNGTARKILGKKGLEFRDGTTRDSNTLVYTFRIRKASTAVFFGFDELDASATDGLSHLGFRFRESLFGADQSIELPPAFQFAVINIRLLEDEWVATQLSKDENSEDAIRHALTRLPFRVIVCGRPTNHSLMKTLEDMRVCIATRPPFGNTTADVATVTAGLSDWLWQEWLAHVATLKSTAKTTTLDLYFHQSETVQPTKAWAEHGDAFNQKHGAGAAVNLRVWGQSSRGPLECVTKHSRAPRPGEPRLVVDRHGAFLSARHGEELSRTDCAIVVDKASSDFDALYNTSFTTPWQLPYELAEAGLLQVLIIDERIVQRANTPYSAIEGARPAFRKAMTDDYEQVPYVHHVARRAGVIIATHVEIVGAGDDRNAKNPCLNLAEREWCRIDESGIDRELGQPPVIIRFTASPRSKSAVEVPGEDIHLVVVHQGVIDLLNDRREEEGKMFVEELSRRYWTVIESGRGIPPEVQDSGEKFLSFSQIDHAFHGKRIAKLGLIRRLMEVTRNQPL